MASKNKNLLIANGHELIGQLSWPSGGGDKWHPYTINDARNTLNGQIINVVDVAYKTAKEFAPRGEVTAKIVLHPAYLAKSYFPATILRDSGLTILGSRPVNINPRISKKVIEKPQVTASIFVSGTADNYLAMNTNLLKVTTPIKQQQQFSRIELIDNFLPNEKIRLTAETKWPEYVHVTIHATEADSDILTSFKELVERLGGSILERGFRFVPGLTFVAVRVPQHNILELAKFTRVRLMRSLPEIQGDWKQYSSITKNYANIQIPTAQPTTTLKTAIFDGGIGNLFSGHATEIAESKLGQSSNHDLSHGINVTSAFLYGPVNHANKTLPPPFCKVDHHRVLPTTQSPELALDVLDRILTALRSAKISGTPYRFANISLGPIATFFDDDVHEWTSRLDTELADGRTLCTVAVGNNGLMDGELGKIQPPGDAVNVFAIGAANSNKKKWDKAPYSAIGPGRSPGYVKPDVVAFGGSDNEPVAIFNPLVGEVVEVSGTSFASPLALRVAVGADILSKSVFEPITIQALMINSTEFSSRSHSREHVGWGRVALNPEDTLYTSPDVVRIVYQGITRPGHPQKAPIPIPKGLPTGAKIIIGATFCYRAPVDSAHAINYTRAGLWVRAYKAPKKPIPLFGSSMYKTEAELRKDAMRWDTVLNAKRTVDAKDMIDPYFHINYQVRDEGEAIRPEDSVPMPYALVVTIEVPGVNDLLDRVQTDFPILKTLSIQTDNNVQVNS